MTAPHGCFGLGIISSGETVPCHYQGGHEGPHSFEKPDPVYVRWRCGRHVHRTIYRMVGPVPSDKDVLIGCMDTRELAAEAVAAHNLRITAGAK